MHLHLTLTSFLASMALAALEARQTSDDLAFLTAASALISGFIPSPVFSELSESVAAAASAASVTGDANSLIYSALEATCMPVWFLGAVPTTYLSSFALLEAQLAALRTAIPPAPGQTTTTAVAITTAGVVSSAMPPAGSQPNSEPLTVVPVTVTQTGLTTVVSSSVPLTAGGAPGSTGVNVSGPAISGTPGSRASSASSVATASVSAFGTTSVTSSSSAAAAPTGVVGHLAAGMVAAAGVVAAF